MSHELKYHEDNEAAICTTGRSHKRSYLTPFFQSQECEESRSNPLTVKRRAAFLREQKKMLAVGSDGQGLLSLMLLSFSVFGHEQNLWKAGVLLGQWNMCEVLVYMSDHKTSLSHLNRENSLGWAKSLKIKIKFTRAHSLYCPIFRVTTSFQLTLLMDWNG